MTTKKNKLNPDLRTRGLVLLQALNTYLEYSKTGRAIDLCALNDSFNTLSGSLSQAPVLKERYNPEDLLTPEQAANILGQSPKTLANKRHSGDGPKYKKLSNRAIRYVYEDLMTFVEDGARMNTSEGPSVQRKKMRENQKVQNRAPVVHLTTHLNQY